LHFINCGWYFDCPKENTLALDFSLHEKNKTWILGNALIVCKHSNARGEEEGVCFGKENID
jgi:hypothetical protein